MANGSGWNNGAELPLRRYPGLEFQKCYSGIHGFLREKSQVQDGLERLDRATLGMDRTRFRSYLAQEEQRFGFAKDPGVIPKEASLLKASRFWGYLMRGEAMVDLGAGDAGGHGVLTHRVQWLLVGQWNDRARRLESPVIALYKNLAAGNARVLTDSGKAALEKGGKIDTDFEKAKVKFFDSLWDDLFDSEEENGTSPEQLFGYMKRNHAGLHDRMLW